MTHIPSKMLEAMTNGDMDKLMEERTALKAKYEADRQVQNKRAGEIVDKCEHKTVLVDESDTDARACAACGAYTMDGVEELADHEDRATIEVDYEIVAKAHRFSLSGRYIDV